MNDIVDIAFTEQEIMEAHEWARYMDAKNDGMKTKDMSPTKNVTGYLGHLALEKYLDAHGFAYETTRTDKMNGGDKYNVAFGDDFIDVKSHRHKPNPTWMHRDRVVVFDHHQHKMETHFCFVIVTPDFTQAYIYGIINVDRFAEISRADELHISEKTYPYHWVTVSELKPIRKYIYHT